MKVGTLLRTARQDARLTQEQLARRLGTTQSAVARLESHESNPTVAHLDRALRATSQRLALRAVAATGEVDETLIRRNLALRPDERIRRFEASYASARELARAGARHRGELA